jgi:hypothetical protein
MLHLVPESRVETAPAPYAEAVARLASIRHALRLVDPFGGGPASDPEDDARIGAAWEEAEPAQRRRFDTRSELAVASAAAGLEAMVGEHAAGRKPHAAASKALADQIRAELEDLTKLMGGR